MGKRFRLRTGFIFEVWPADPKDSEVKRVAILGRMGGYHGLFKFVADDIQTIVDALNQALLQEGKPE